MAIRLLDSENTREILALPPDSMSVIAEAVEWRDVPQDFVPLVIEDPLPGENYGITVRRAVTREDLLQLECMRGYHIVPDDPAQEKP